MHDLVARTARIAGRIDPGWRREDVEAQLGALRSRRRHRTRERAAGAVAVVAIAVAVAAIVLR
ncbi:MAG: hypothetical protein KIT31_26970, partial [Deltaproteobacteria bacterium]|nr:hypothetical protein [Deltaproteobacteria bacterium]